MRPPAAALPRFLTLLFAVAVLAPAVTSASDDASAPIVGLKTQIEHRNPLGDPVDQTPDPESDRRESIEFVRISREQGLSHSTVTAITQDQTGYMWFGTEDGLNKYDGYTFTTFRPDPQRNSISHIFVWTVYQDRDGTLWIGTLGGGLNRFDRRTGRFTNYSLDPGNRYSLNSNGVSAILEDRAGALWVGTLGGGLNRFDRESQRFRHYMPDEGDPRSLSHHSVWAIYEDRDGVLWVGTTNGLNRFDPDREQFVRYLNDPNDPHSLSNDIVQSILEDHEGALWVGTLGGLNRLDRATGRFTRYQHSPGATGSLSHDNVEAIYEDQDGVLWIGTAGGLDRFEPEADRFMNYRNELGDPTSLSENWVRSIFEDREGVLWIGTYGGGLNKVDRSAERFAHYKHDPSDANSLSGNVIWAIYEDPDGILWIGTNGQGLNKLDRTAGQYTHYLHEPGDPDSLSNNVVRSICPDGDGKLWIGTDGGGVDHFDPETGRFRHIRHDPDDPGSLSADRVRIVYEDLEGVLWVGTRGGGLNEYDRENTRFIHYTTSVDSPRPLRSDTISSLLQDRKGIFWVGTIGGGLHMADRPRNRYVAFRNDPNDASSLSENSVLSIHEDRSGALWVGTLGGGLNKYHRETETFTRYRVQDGLPNNIVYGILEDDVPADQGGPYLWLSTNDGLSRFDPRTETFKNFDTSDGLQSQGFYAGAYYKSSSGEMFFGGINGLNAFFPDRVDTGNNPHIPPIVLTSLTQGGEPVALDVDVDGAQTVTLNWPNNHFEFEFAALSFVNPAENRYAYKLEGFDKDWNNTGALRYGRYTNLPGGTYTLRIKGSNNDEVWNEEGASISIVIPPPIWNTLWFRGSVALLLLALVVGIYRQRVKNVEARSRDLEAQVQERTAELRLEIDQRMQVEEALRQSEMEKAVAAERNRLARELHDAVSQTLFSASLMAEALPDIWENDLEEAKEYLTDLQQLNRGALAEMRTLLLELRPTALADAELGELLNQLAQAVTSREGVPVTVTVENESDLPVDVHVALYRIAQEALNNVVKHARAKKVHVSLDFTTKDGAPTTEAERVELRVSDDGRGFDAASVQPDQLGLGIMRERAEVIGAEFRLDSAPGAGTRIGVVWTANEEGPDE
jgi:signal transduction histidine kinase/ligand-binding sensor domain-containing protein